jgi:predicted DsbA family dithiol-disulfide isomerase
VRAHTIITGLFAAFDAGRELQDDDLLAAIADSRPLSRSRAREIAALTTWAQNNAKMAN